MPEGSIVGASGFAGRPVFGKFSIEADADRWRLVSGTPRGRTFTSTADGPSAMMAVWNQPIDVSFSCTSLLGWPKFVIEIMFHDEEDRVDFAGYGFCHLPAATGQHTIKVATYRPRGSVRDDIACRFLGGYPQYIDTDVVSSSEGRLGHRTITTGVVHIDINVVLKGFRDEGVYVDSQPPAF